MTEGASCQKPLRALGSLRLWSCALETSDRGGQDKAHKVRAVGRDGQQQKIPAFRQTLRNIGRTLRCLGTRYRRSIFDTL
jgi:hypothetical protein